MKHRTRNRKEAQSASARRRRLTFTAKCQTHQIKSDTMPKTTRRSSMQQAMQNISKHTFNSEVRLQMECTEEELQPCQKLSFKQAYDEFNRINKYINDVQTGRATISPNMPNSTTTMLNEPAKPIPSSQNQSDPDVIVVGESPPQAKKAVSSKLPSLPGNLTLPPLPNSNQSVLAFPQQVYKFVNGGQQSDMVKVGNRFFIRPIMPVAPQQNVAMQNTATRPVSMLKRSVEFDTDRKMASKREMDESGNWVPLDEFYYGKKEGDPTYTEDKGEYRFKCWYCSKMLYNNVKTMMHMQGHIDSEKQQNLDLSDLTQCKHCYKQFDTPFEMQTHIEKVHMYNSNVLMCRICEKDCDSRITLTTHMRSNHNACEMPYMCQLCGFRSSMYSDVVDHFKKKHDSSANLLCLYCLKSFNIKFISTGWGQTQNYYHHLLKHQSKNKVRKCQVCKLTFFNPQDVKSHRQKDHLPNLKGVKGMNSKYTTPDQVMIKVPEQGLQPKPIKSLNAPIISKVRDNHLLLPGSVREVNCLECKLCMSTPDHYKKYIQCSMCRFATSCSFAYANHMMGFHSGQITSISLNIPKERPMEHIMYCMCGYASKYGNNIANHMVYCTKRTCYKEKPDVPVYDYENKEIQDPRKKPGASLLDVLGLVKKTSASEGDDVNESNQDMEAIQSSSPSTSSSSSSRGKKSSSWFRIKLDPKKNDEKTSKDEEDLDSSSEKDEVSENKKNTSEDSILIDDSVKDNDSKNISVKDDISDIAPKDDLSKESISNDDPKASQDKLSEDKVSVPKEDVDQNPKDKVTTDSEQNQKSAKTLGEIVKETETSVSKNATSQDNATLPSTESVDDMDTSEIEQTKSPANDTLEEINKTCAENDKSYDNMTNSSTSDSKPTDTEQEPIEEDAKPTRAEQEAETEQEPTEEDAKPTEAEQEATEEDAKPIEGEQEPTEEDAKSTEAEQEATKEDAKPIEGEQEPTEEDAKPTEAEQEPMEEGSSKSEALDTNVSDSPDVYAQSEKDSVPESIPQKLEDLSDISTETETKNSDISKKNKPEDTEDKPEDFIEDSLPEVRDDKEKSSLIQEDKNIEEINQESKHSEEKKSEETQPDAAQKISGDPDQETWPGTSKDSTQITQTTDKPVHEDSNLEGTQSQTQSSSSEASASKSSDRSSSRRDSEDRHRHSDDLSRSYDREREYRNRDRNRDRSHRDDYRDRSRDQHYDRDRKYDRDYDRHGRDRNRDYGNHGNQSNRDYRRNDYHGRDRERDYDNRNYNRRGKGQGYQDNRDRRYY